VLAVHAEGSIEAEKLTILMQYERERAIEYARWLGGLDGDGWPPYPVSDNGGTGSAA
jgi:hypothetical protein